MRAAILIVLLLCIPLAHAQLDTSDLYERQELLIDATISSSLMVQKESSRWAAEYVAADVMFVPQQNNGDEIHSLETFPEAEQSATALHFLWEEPSEGKKEYRIESRITSRANMPTIRSKVSYPPAIPQALEQYIIATESIDITPEIRQKAKELANGEDDLYIVTNNVAVWVRDNIEYDLTTANAQATYSASQVFAKRAGVCDELTNLFLAMMRSLGVPARFVSGIAYTNSDLFDEKWGPHGWAEVYFPGVGWVPFDPTYGQFGWVDATHIKLHEGDATEPSTKFEWRGRNLNVEVAPLDFEVNVLERGGKLDPKVELRTELLHDEVGFGSYNLVEGIVQNTGSSYQTVDLILADTEGVNIISPKQVTVPLKPRQIDHVYWLIKLDEGFKSNFVYTLPMMVYDVRNISSTKKITATYDAPIVARESAERAERLADQKDDRLSCKEEQATIVCTVKEPAYVCASSCKQGEGRVVFEKKFRAPGYHSEGITAKFDDTILEDEVSYVIYDAEEAAIELKEINTQVQYDDNFTVEFIIRRSSFAPVGQGHVSVLLNERAVQTWDYQGLDQPHKFLFQMHGWDLKAGKNTITITSNHADKQSTTVELTGLSVTQRMKTWFIGFARWMESLTS